MTGSEGEERSKGSVAAGNSQNEKPSLVDVYAQRPDDYEGTCLRPLGLCELGGCCDVCWYGPNSPRFNKG